MAHGHAFLWKLQRLYGFDSTINRCFFNNLKAWQLRVVWISQAYRHLRVNHPVCDWVIEGLSHMASFILWKWRTILYLADRTGDYVTSIPLICGLSETLSETILWLLSAPFFACFFYCFHFLFLRRFKCWQFGVTGRFNMLFKCLLAGPYASFSA